MNRAWLAYYAIASCTSLTALIVACSGSSDSGLLGAAGSTSSSTGGTTATSSGTTATSGGTGTGTSGATSGGTSGGTSGTVTTDGGNEGGGPPPTPCNWAATNPCGAGLYCSTKANQNGCGAGFCVPIPTTDTGVRSPVCGCDGITYWNDSVAAKHGMSFRKQLGPCPANLAVRCGGLTPAPNECRPGASCNHKIASKNQCDISLDRAGDCWQLPTQCPPAPTKLTSHACQSINCTDECNLIKLMTEWYEDTECP